MILTKEVEVKPSGKTIQYYINKGYDAKYHVPLFVKVEDLCSSSKIKVEVKCDYCGEIKTIQYADYLKSVKLRGKYSCAKCAYNKTRETNLFLYGVENYSSTKECKDKVARTNIERYGVKNPAMLDDVKEKIKQTNVERYNCEHTLQSEIVREKSKQTCLKKYGVEYALQSPEIREKGVQKYYQNSSQMASKQQVYLRNLYGGELNYPVKYYNADVCLFDEKLCIEYDGSGHGLSVIHGNLTQDEFNHKEIVRNSVFKYEGYKQMRIISSKDLLPTDQLLLQMLEETRKYFSQYPNHSWIEFNIDTSTIHNAECKDGVFFDFGKLRRIKDSDVSKQIA